MKQGMYVVKDVKADACLTPVFFRTDFEAQRAFSDAVNSKSETPLSAHPEDFVLLRVASYDVVTGDVTPEASPVSLGLGIDFKNKE